MQGTKLLAAHTLKKDPLTPLDVLKQKGILYGEEMYRMKKNGFIQNVWRQSSGDNLWYVRTSRKLNCAHVPLPFLVPSSFFSTRLHWRQCDNLTGRLHRWLRWYELNAKTAQSGAVGWKWPSAYGSGKCRRPLRKLPVQVGDALSPCLLFAGPFLLPPLSQIGKEYKTILRSE